MVDASKEGSQFDGANVLITGGLGFIGSSLAHKLVDAGANVVLVDSMVPEYGGNRFNVSDIEDLIRINISDVRDPFSVKHLVAGQDVVFNLAGQTSHLDSMTDPFTDLEINCRAQLSILEACRTVNPAVRLVYASTRQIYGRPEKLPVDENHPLRPTDVNGINKIAGEAYHRLYSDVYGIRSCVLRLTNTYGPRMRIKDARQTFLGVWIKALVQDEPFEVWEGEQLRDFTYVDDAVNALMLAAGLKAEQPSVYNLGGCEVVSLLQLADILVEVNGGGRFTVRDFPQERKRIDIGDYFADDSLIERSLGWAPRIPLSIGLEKTISYYRSHLEKYL